MAPTIGQRLRQRWRQYRPSKLVCLLFGVSCVALTTVGGFTQGGWVTSGTARSMAAAARQDARATVLASVCVDRFTAAPDASENLEELKAISSRERLDFIAMGGWADVRTLQTRVSGAVDRCAERLVAMDRIPPRVVDPIAKFINSTTVGG